MRRESDARHGPVDGEQWTFETLDLHLDLSVERVRELFEQYVANHAQLHGLEREQTQITATSLARRLDDMNAWRAQLVAERIDFVGVGVFGAHVETQNIQVNRLQHEITALQQDIIRLTSSATVTDGIVKVNGVNIVRLEERVPALMTRELYDDQHGRLVDRVDVMEKWRATVAGRTLAITSVVGLASGTFGVILGHTLFH